MIGANAVGLIAPCLKQSYVHSLEMNPRIPVGTPPMYHRIILAA